MGLDMFLYKVVWLSEYDKDMLKLKQDIEKHFNIGSAKEIKLEIAYWRKANHIHKWIMDTCGSGDEEEYEVDISFEQLMELKELCEKVIADNSKAEELLPTTEGFFFGGTEYDEYYFEWTKSTIEMLDKIHNNKVQEKLNGKKVFDTFKYYASW